MLADTDTYYRYGLVDYRPNPNVCILVDFCVCSLHRYNFQAN